MISLFAPQSLNVATGYGKLEAGLVQGFAACGVPLRVATPTTNRRGQWAKTRLGGTVLVTGFPTWAERLSGAKRLISFTMSESTRVSRDWVDTLNERFERVVVPCPPLVEVYRDSGVTIPIHCVPMGVDLNPPRLAHRRPYPTEFTFLTYSLGDMRKGAELAMFAFKRLFDGTAGCKMIVKARDGWNSTWLAGLDEPNITIIGGERSEAEWYALLASVQCLLFPSRGEGFGLPPREAVLTGLPVIATQWLGMYDADRWGYPIPVKEMHLAQFDTVDANDDGALWSLPDVAVLERHMQFVYSHYAHALLHARRGRQYLLEHFTWKKAARQILRLIEGEG
jgi:glycosyltransferase involved in cell wall biosynthesis